MIKIDVRSGAVFRIDAPYAPASRGGSGHFEMESAVEERIGTIVRIDGNGPWPSHEGPWRFQAEAPLTQEDLIKVFHKLEGANMRSQMLCEQQKPDDLPERF